MRLHSGDYNLAATTNLGRFQADVLLQIARWARAREPEGGPLIIRQDDWFWAYLKVADLTFEEAPISARLAYAYGQDLQIDYRFDRVIRNVEGRRPVVAVNVRIWWPELADGPTKYSYRDTLSTPELKVTSNRVISYRLLDLGDMIVYDEIRGVSGRPTSGPLGLLFRIIGEGRLLQSRIAISHDGLQVVRSRSKKLFISVTTTATVYPDGRAVKDLPPEISDLTALEARLGESLKIEYMPYEC